MLGDGSSFSSGERQRIVVSLMESSAEDGGAELDFEQLEEDGLEHVGKSSVYTLYKEMQPKVRPVGASKQGSRDKTSAWSKARLNWVLQLIVRFGIFIDHAALPPDVSEFDTAATV